MKKIFLIRHGESEANSLGKHQGFHDEWSDTSLTQRGREQANEVGKRLKEEKIDLIYSSNFRRAKETAEIIAKYHNKKVIHDSRINEWTEPEPLDDFIERCSDFIYNLPEGKNIIVVAHGGANKTMMAVLATKGMEEGGRFVRRVKQSNTTVNVLERDGKNYRLKEINSLDHFVPDKKIMDLFYRVQKIPYKVMPFNEDDIDERLKEGDCRHKAHLLKTLLKKEGYTAKRIIAIFDWKDLPLPKKVISVLKKSSTVWAHTLVRVKFNGDYLYLDPTWDPALEKAGFPVTRNWSGLEDTKQVTEGELDYFRPGEYDKEKLGIKVEKEEAYEFSNLLNDWLDEVRKR